jgi:ATP-dependent helicase/nuclease subunit A
MAVVARPFGSFGVNAPGNPSAKQPARLYPLQENQVRAVDPRDSVWLSASAGTGKTQVLSARVLRLLLGGVRPDQILCLTFTKAGATEMAARINDTLARWVRLDDARLAADLKAIGGDIGQPTLAHARTLFAAVLDSPGGGLRIDTIHAFAQWLLAAFPEEAGLIPGARPMEDRERALLARQVLADLLIAAEARGDTPTMDALANLSLRLGPDDVERYLLRCTESRDAWFGHGAWQPPMAASVLRLLGLPADTDGAGLAELCGDRAFDTVSLRRCFDTHRAWQARTGQDRAEIIADWLEQEPAERLARIDYLHEVFFTQKGEPRSSTSLDRIDAEYPDHASRVGTCIAAVRERRALLDLAAWLAPALELGRAFALAWDEAKAREGLIDFDDQIRRAADLLHRSDMAEWIRYKLDRRFDHILVDEAQDTNAAQWRIIKALTDDFYAGEGAHGLAVRTLFVVGDYKQAIFGFQGTSPENFSAAGEYFDTTMAAAAMNANAVRGGREVRTLQPLGLDRSFRTAASVLKFIDRAIAHLGQAVFGLKEHPDPHIGEERPGYVALWRPVGLKSEEAADDEPAEDSEDGQQGWLAKPDRELAERLARQVKFWLVEGFPLVKGLKSGEPPRRAGAGDVMVLVRKRGALAALIVARLHAHGVPVAGVDRLRLGAPLAVRDLIAALRFAAQPLDDLNLAALLTSPLVSWSQEQLLAHGWRPKGVRLWDHLRQLRGPEVVAALDQLGDLLRIADYEPVQALLHWLLVGPWDGRRRLVARLGREVNDPIDELINAAHAFAATATPSLVGFLAWFDAGDGEVKREASGGGDLVRVMTVHGAKGLQAPIVILADATGNPEAARGSDLALLDPASEFAGEPRAIPLPALRKEERLGRIAEAAAKAAKAENEEHWRLLYVAMTRAEEALFVTGVLGTREKVPAPGSWYARLAELPGDDDWIADEIWGARLEHGTLPVMPPAASVPADVPQPAALPGWLTRPIGPEPRPPRPLAPSALGEDLSADPPLAAGGDTAWLAAAARRGTLIHRLLERLPAVAQDRRATAARHWLTRQAADLGEDARAEIAGAALTVIADPRWAELFAPDALAEVPIAALVGSRMVVGTIDRLIVAPTRIRLVDFKTARRPPATLAQVPAATLRQLAAYAAALAAAYPGRAVEAALLYTQTPALIEIPGNILEDHKQALLAAEESLGA